MQKIQAKCDEWVEIWNNHEISGERRTPNQMYMDFSDCKVDETDNFGIEYNGVSVPAYRPKEIVVPEKLDVPGDIVEYIVNEIIAGYPFDDDEQCVYILVAVVDYLEDTIEVVE